MSIVLLVLVMVLIPGIIGLPFTYKPGEGFGKSGSILLYGYLIMWAVFELVAVPVILTTNQLMHVIGIWAVVMAVFACVCVIWSIFLWKKRKISVATCGQNSGSKWENRILCVIFSGLLIFQIYSTVTMAYADGDTAYYLPITMTALANGSMYQVDSYTGFATGLDVRHALAPFPIWIAALARLSNIHGAVMMQTILPCVLIPLSYMSVGAFGRKLLGEKSKEGIWYFLILAEVVVIFANYSLYTQGTFLLTRTGQGKAVLAGIVIPAILLILYELITKSDKEKKIKYQVLLLAAICASCLCSTLGSFLSAMCIGMVALIRGILTKSFKEFWKLALYLIPCILFVGIYYLLG